MSEQNFKREPEAKNKYTINLLTNTCAGSYCHRDTPAVTHGYSFCSPAQKTPAPPFGRHLRQASGKLRKYNGQHTR